MPFNELTPEQQGIVAEYTRQQLATGTFVYDLQWRDAAGGVQTVSLGAFVISGDVTRSVQ